MKRTVLAGGLVLLGLGTLAMAQILPSGDGAASGALPAAPAPTPAADTLETLDAQLKELREMQVRMSEAERKAEDDFLNLKIGPDVDVSGIERVPSAVENQPYRTCEKTPQMQANLRSPGSRGNRAYRDISGYLSVTNVIATKDCTCSAKVIPHEAVAAFEDRLRQMLGVTILLPKHTSDLYDGYDKQKIIVDAMCGDY